MHIRMVFVLYATIVWVFYVVQENWENNNILVPIINVYLYSLSTSTIAIIHIQINNLTHTHKNAHKCVFCCCLYLCMQLICMICTIASTSSNVLAFWLINIRRDYNKFNTSSRLYQARFHIPYNIRIIIVSYLFVYIIDYRSDQRIIGK